ncbi:uncharacterized protein L201_007252 [Kwoniella dendrophila CBS 6074]|uniref:Uncharacterized protein n=1 Tax=Kwoniella dendrophila CBS 6074 TaxID=1295534 RepID=A0AAX4K5E3_9TREE
MLFGDKKELFTENLIKEAKHYIGDWIKSKKIADNLNKSLNEELRELEKEEDHLSMVKSKFGLDGSTLMSTKSVTNHDQLSQSQFQLIMKTIEKEIQDETKRLSTKRYNLEGKSSSLIRNNIGLNLISTNFKETYEKNWNHIKYIEELSENQLLNTISSIAIINGTIEDLKLKDEWINLIRIDTDIRRKKSFLE